MKKLLLSLLCTVALTSCCTDYEAVVTYGTPVVIEGRSYYYYNDNYYWHDGGRWRIYYPHHRHYHYYTPPRRHEPIVRPEPRRPHDGRHHDSGRRRR